MYKKPDENTDLFNEGLQIYEIQNLFRHGTNANVLEYLSYSSRSLFKYPGGKSRAVEFITSFFPKIKLSPFLGGGSIELNLASKGTKVIAYDVFLPLVNFGNAF